MIECDRDHDMVADAFVAHDEVKEPIIDAKKFDEMLDAANQPITVFVEKVSLNYRWLLE